MKNPFRRLISHVLVKAMPELEIIRDNSVSWSYLKSSIIDSRIDSFTKIQSPYKLNSVVIGKGTYLSHNSNISLTTIGKYCSIGPNFFCGWGIHPTDGLSTSPMFYSTMKQNGTTISKSNKIAERELIEIGNDVFIGANVTVLDGIKIEHGAIIGAGAVVSKDIPAYSIAVGSPIKILRKRFSDENIEKLLKIKWWDFNEKELKDVEVYFFEIEDFLKKYDSKNKKII